MERAQGVICWVGDSGTVGYIAEDERRYSKLYLHASKVTPPGTLKVLQRVSYDRFESSLSGTEARNVRLVTEERTVERQRPGPVKHLLKLITEHAPSAEKIRALLPKRQTS